MKLFGSILTLLGLSVAITPAGAQFYLNGLNNYNNSGIVSYYTDSALVGAAGSYTAAGAARTIHGGKVLHIDGPYTAATGSVDSFTGDGSTAWPPVNAPKTISGAVAPVFGAVTFMNGAGQTVAITNSGGATVGNSAHFGNGITTTVRGNTSTGALRFLDNATYTNSALGDAQYVNGYVSKIGNDAFTFPVGSQAGNDLRSLQIGAPATITDHLSIAYWLGNASGIDPTPAGTQSLSTLNPSGTTGIDRLFSVSPLCFWDWIPVNGNSPLTITVSLPDFSGNGGYTNAANMRLVGWNTATLQWDNLSGATGASGLTEGSTLSGAVTDMSIYSAIAIGNVQDAPLPTNIIAFSGTMDNSCNAHLTWKTGVETNLKQYEVEYSADGRTFATAGTVSPGAASHQYNFTMAQVPTGVAFFRLLIADNDGTIAYHERLLRLQNDCRGAAPITVSPNPANDVLVIKGMQGQNSIRLFDLTGRQLLLVPTGGSNKQIDLSRFGAGMYWLQITNSTGTEVIRTKIVKR